MRAISVSEYGGPDVLVPVTLTDPEPGDGDVVIRAEAIDTIHVETRIRAGWGGRFGFYPPFVPGGAAAGRVVAAGRWVDESWLGRRVVATPGRSAYADLVVSGLDHVLAVPDGLDLRAAAALGHDGVTGTLILDRVAIEPGDRVLILAAAGGMGALLVQAAHAAGAEVIGAARGAAKLDLVRRLGADATVDYTVDGWTDAVGAVDVLLDGAGGELGRAATDLVADGGRISVHGASSGDFAAVDPEGLRARRIGLTTIGDLQVGTAVTRELLGRALTAAAEGSWHPVIAREFPLQEAAAAHRAIEAREVAGKALLIP